jgi:hypothetical protein
LDSNLDDDSVMPGTHAGAGVVVDTPPVSARDKPNVLKQYANRVWLVLEDSDNIPPTGQFFGHNGVGFMLKAAEPAEVPVEIVDILNNAIYHAPVVDPQTQQIISYRPRLRFPYRLVAPPSKELHT